MTSLVQLHEEVWRDLITFYGKVFTAGGRSGGDGKHLKRREMGIFCWWPTGTRAPPAVLWVSAGDSRCGSSSGLQVGVRSRKAPGDVGGGVDSGGGVSRTRSVV